MLKKKNTKERAQIFIWQNASDYTQQKSIIKPGKKTELDIDAHINNMAFHMEKLTV